MLVARASLAEAQDASALTAYTAPGSCPPGTVFSEQLAARTRLWRGATGLSVAVEIRAVPEGVLGRVALERDGQRTEREIVAPHCDEVVEALALIVAILIDPLADTRPLPIASPRATSTPTPPARAASARADSPERRWFVFAGTEFALEGSFAPGLNPGVRVFGGAIRGSPAAPVSSLRLSAFYALSGTIPAEGEAWAAFELGGGRLEVCSYGFSEGSFRLVPCVFGELAALQAEGHHPAGPRSETILWAALGPALRGNLNYSKVLFFELEVGAVFPLVTYRFAFRGEEPLYQTVIAPEFAAGVGIRFP